MIPIQDPLESAELLAFTRIVETKSFSRAAAELGVPRATVGRRLGRLEERLGTRLLRRTTRSLALTDAGEVFYRQARIALDAMTQAQQSVRRSDSSVCGILRVSVPPMLDESFLAMITAFAQKYPDVRLQVDFSTRLVDLRRDGYDVAFRATTVIEPGLMVRTLARTHLIAVASPTYLAAHGTPKMAKDLRKHRCLMGFARGELPQSSWPVGRGAIHIEGVFASNEIRLLHFAAVQGLGIALLPTTFVADQLERGELVHVLPKIVRSENHIAVVYPEREFLPPQVRAFVDAVVAWAPALQAPRRAPESAGPRRNRTGRS